MQTGPSRLPSAWTVAVLSLWLGPAAAHADDFFEARIRPVLVQHCYKCHSADSPRLRGGLRLDTAEGLRKGGDTGPVVVPGRPNESLLVRALKYQGLEMPPGGKLPAAVIADFERWVAAGAVAPRAGAKAPVAAGIDFDAARRHWAYQAVRDPVPPLVKARDWPVSAIDVFVLAGLEKKGLFPSPPADPRTLIRRLYLDLTGLPPPPKAVDAFVRDPSPEAVARITDDLLATPHYGERWGRHWLDVARYADTKDLVLVFGPDRVRPYAYTYRDYVIRAFNEDLPYDRFVIDQLAADQVRPAVEPWRLAALGFLTLGRLFDNNLPDIHDDQIDTVTRGLLGLTVSCARCHDHKYDAIPTADYYSLYGVFASCEQPLEQPLLAEPARTPAYLEFEKKWQKTRDDLRRHIDTQHRDINELFRNQTADYLRRAALEPPDPLETAIFFLSLSPNDLRPQVVARWRKYLEKRSRPDDPVFGPWHDLLALPDAEFAARSGEVLVRWHDTPAGTAPGQLNPMVREAMTSAKLTARADVVAAYATLLQKAYKEGETDDPAGAQLRAVIDGPASPFFFPKSTTYLYMSRVPRSTYAAMLQYLDRLAVDSPEAPPRAMTVVDTPEPFEPFVFLRGNPRQAGPPVRRQFLRVLSRGEPEPFTRGSGRLDLARAVADPANPLTARVLVNRVWMHHFGEPLVATPSDFGVRGSPPTHPELLDHLAATFVRDGWSLKKLHRRIVLSRAYQQASADRPDCRKVDPENRLLWRYPRRPLDLEAMRDSLLAVSGRLDRTVGGRPVDVAGDPANRRRTVYGLVDRQDLPGLFRVFNFASPDQTAPRRPQTTVPQQALFALNSPFMLEQAKSLADRAEVTAATEPADRVRALYRLALQREPTPREAELAAAFVRAARGETAEGLTPWQQFAQVLLMTNEFVTLE